MDLIARKPVLKPRFLPASQNIFQPRIACLRGGGRTGAHDSAGIGKVACFAKKDDRRSFNFEKEEEGKGFRVTVNESQFILPEQTFLVSGLVLLGLAAIIGPIVIGLAVTAVTVGFTLSMGAFAVSTMFLPMAIFSLFMFLTVGGFFGGFALLGLGVFMPKVLSLVVAGAGLAVGWMAVQMLIPAAAGKRSDLNSGSKPGATSKRKEQPQQQEGPVVIVDPEEEEVKRRSQELRDFDELLADRDHMQRVSQWKKDSQR